MSPRLTIRQKYFRWLYNQCFPVWDLDSPLSYINLCDILHRIQFNDGVPNDDNRAADGEELRDEFISTQPGIGVDEYAQMQSLGKASLFEVLVALSRRAHPIAEVLSPAEWFRKFIENLGLLGFADSRYDPADKLRIERVLRRWNKRIYNRNGRGGIFPLTRQQVDQTTVELWYQMSAYMTENQMY